MSTNNETTIDATNNNLPVILSTTLVCSFVFFMFSLLAFICYKRNKKETTVVKKSNNLEVKKQTNNTPQPSPLMKASTIKDGTIIGIDPILSPAHQPSHRRYISFATNKSPMSDLFVVEVLTPETVN